MSAKADERLAKLASFGAKAAAKQQQTVVADPPQEVIAAQPANASEFVLIRNVAFTEREQEILKMIMERLREAGEFTPSFWSGRRCSYYFLRRIGNDGLLCHAKRRGVINHRSTARNCKCRKFQLR